MATKEIPKQFVHTCDGCKKAEINGSSSRPTYWTVLKIEADAYDYQGCAVASANQSHLLCQDCTSAVHKAINDTIVETRKSA